MKNKNVGKNRSTQYIYSDLTAIIVFFVLISNVDNPQFYFKMS